MIDHFYKAASGILLATTLLTGCMTAPHLNAPSTPRTTPVFDLIGTAFPTFDRYSLEPSNGQQKLIPYLPYTLPAHIRSQKSELDQHKFSTYITSNGTPNALLYNDTLDALLVTQVAKSGKTTTTDQLTKVSSKSIDKVLKALESKYTVELASNRAGYNDHQFSQQPHPFLARRYLVVSKDESVSVSTIRNDMLSVLYGRPTNPQASNESQVKNKVFYIDLTTWSDLEPISSIHLGLWVHPVNFSDRSYEYDWLDAHKNYLNSNVFIHYAY